jgi:hypothetical protein
MQHEDARCLLSELESTPLSKSYRLLTPEEESAMIGLPWPFDEDSGGDDAAGTLLRLSRFPAIWVSFASHCLSVSQFAAANTPIFFC